MVADRCPACDGEIRAGRWRHYHECGRCGGGWLRGEMGQPQRIFSSTYFEAGTSGGYDNYLADEALHRRNARITLARVPRGTESLLDVGGAAGFLASEAERLGMSADLVDVSDWARREASARIRGRVAASLSEVEGPYEVIVMRQVLEHMVDPLTALLRCFELLAPGGRLLLETWDATSVTARVCGRFWQQLTPSSVVHLFSRPGLRAMLGRAGFAAVTVSRTHKWVSSAFALNLAITKLGVPRPKRVPRLGLPYWFDDLVVVSATRSGDTSSRATCGMT